MTICVFGYGSLINRESAENALKRPLDSQDMLPVVLPGHVRAWKAKETIWFEAINAQKTAVFLDLAPMANAHVNGILIKITESELAQLKLREKNYDCVEITPCFESPPCKTVYAFISRSENRLQSGDRDVYIPLEYVRLVEVGCKNFGHHFLLEFYETTEASELPRLGGPYHFVDPIQANFI